ncbi:hypothetical protein OB920_18465 [Halobacteria archaeon HArc-gm2]|nr:hypothetical protein [Halobacteria archaeon HArc-gm2]
MRRRALLKASPSLLAAGCIGTPGSQGPQSGVAVEATVTDPADEYAVTVDVVDVASEEALADLHITVTNTGDDTVSVSSGAPKPFGILVADSVDTDAALLLWTERYTTSSGIGTDEYRVESWTDGYYTIVLQPADSLSATYTLREETSIGDRSTAIAGGRYELSGYDEEPFEINGTPADVDLEILQAP